MDISNSRVKISYLDTFNTSGISVYQGVLAFGNDLGEFLPIPELSWFTFSHNTIRKPLGNPWAGIELGDYSHILGTKTMEVSILNNDIRSEPPTEPFGPIYGAFVEDAVVRNNRISGTGLAGIYAGIYDGATDEAILDTNWTIMGNNLENFNADVANIWLGIATSGFTVVGGNNKTGVLDEGTGNLLVGVNNMHGNSPGDELKSALQRKRDMLKKATAP